MDEIGSESIGIENGCHDENNDADFSLLSLKRKFAERDPKFSSHNSSEREEGSNPILGQWAIEDKSASVNQAASEPKSKKVREESTETSKPTAIPQPTSKSLQRPIAPKPSILAKNKQAPHPVTDSSGGEVDMPEKKHVVLGQNALDRIRQSKATSVVRKVNSDKAGPSKGGDTSSGDTSGATPFTILTQDPLGDPLVDDQEGGDGDTIASHEEQELYLDDDFGDDGNEDNSDDDEDSFLTPGVTIEEGEGEVDLGVDLEGGSSRKKPRKQSFGWRQMGQGNSRDSTKETPKEKEDLIAELHGITIPQSGVTGNCPVEGCGKWFQHLRTHIVSMHAPKEPCPHCGVKIVPRYMREHVLAEHEGREVIRYKEVRCPLCQKTVQQYSLRKHFINAHQYSKEEAQTFYHQFYPKQNRFKEDPFAPACPLCKKKVKDLRKHIKKICKADPGTYMDGNRLKPEYVSEDVSNGRMADSSTVPILHPPKFVVDKINTMASNEVVSSQQQSNKRRGRPLRSSRVAKQKQDFKSKIVPSLRTYYDRTKEGQIIVQHVYAESTESDPDPAVPPDFDPDPLVKTEIEVEENEVEPIVKVEPEEHHMPEDDGKARCPVCYNNVSCEYMERHLKILHKFEGHEIEHILSGFGIPYVGPVNKKGKPSSNELSWNSYPPSFQETLPKKNALASVTPSKPNSIVIQPTKPTSGLPQSSISDDGQKKYKCTVCGNLVMKNFLKKHFSILHRMSPEEIEAAVATLSPIQ